MERSPMLQRSLPRLWMPCASSLVPSPKAFLAGNPSQRPGRRWAHGAELEAENAP